MNVSMTLIVLCSLFISGSAQALVLPGHGQWGDIPGTDNPGKTRGLLQYRTGEHIVAFSPGHVYMVSPDHALSVEFVGGREVEPDAISVKGSVDVEVPGLSGWVQYPDQWEGITVRYEASEMGIAESTYILEPGSDARAIKLRYNAPVEIGPDGSLRFQLSSKNGWMTETPPVAWQEISGSRVPVEVAFKVRDGVVGFDVGAYDHRRRLVIDPTYRWHTFYGSYHNGDEGRAIAVDGAGNVYITGTSYQSSDHAAWLGPNGELPLHAHSGHNDIFVLKLNRSGVYQWHTFYGGTYDDQGRAIAVDASGNVYVAGWSVWSGGPWPDAPNPLHASVGSSDIAILKLDSSGKYQWHTFYGSPYTDEGDGIAVDENGCAYVVGTSSSVWLGDASTNSLHSHSGGTGNDDIAILKLDANGAYQWHTFYGSAASNANGDGGYGIAVDGSGNVYTTGYSYSTWQGDGGIDPLHQHSPEEQGKTGQNSDIAVLKLDGDGIYQWHTFYGAVDGYWATGDFGYAVAVDGGGNVYVKGESSETWEGAGGANPLHAYSDGIYNVAILKLDTDGAYKWHTFYGANAHPDNTGPGKALAVSGGGVYLTGYSYDIWKGDGNSDPVHTLDGGRNVWILKLDADSGDYRWHTFYGAGLGGNTTGFDIAVDANRNVHVTGYSTETWQGDKGKNPLNPFSDDQDYHDIAIMKLSDPIVPVKVVSPNGGQILDSGSNFTIEWTAPYHAVKFKLYYSEDNGATWTKLHSRPFVTGSSYTWAVPTPPGNKLKCLVKVIGYTWNGKKAGQDVSDAAFGIAVVTLTAPNGGQNLVGGSVTGIRWRKNETLGITKTVTLYYTVDGGATWKPIETLTGAYDTPGIYKYSWKVPSFAATKRNCRVKVVLKNSGGTILGIDTSDAKFTITPP